MYSSGVRTSTAMIGHSRMTGCSALGAASLNAIEPAILKAISEESTGCILAVVDRGLGADRREAGERAGFHGFLDTGLDGSDELGADVATSNLVLELEGLAGLGVEGLEVHEHLCELAGTTGLLLVGVDLVEHGLADGLAVGDLRLADVALDLELPGGAYGRRRCRAGARPYLRSGSGRTLRRW